MAESCGCGCGHGDKTLTIAARPGRYAGDERVGDVARDPAALSVLERFGLNHCCGGHLSLREGAAAAGAELPALLRALEEVAGRAA
jgi:iron-sulfur cluster repair protein YtfE (RIC family)